MCLAVPALIRSIDGDEAEVELGGVSRRASLMLTPEAKAGDYVLLHAGYAILHHHGSTGKMPLTTYGHCSGPCMIGLGGRHAETDRWPQLDGLGVCHQRKISVKGIGS